MADKKGKGKKRTLSQQPSVASEKKACGGGPKQLVCDACRARPKDAEWELLSRIGRASRAPTPVTANASHA